MQIKANLNKKQVKDVCRKLISMPAVVKQNATMNEVLKSVMDDTRTRHAYVVDETDKLVGEILMNSLVEFLFPYVAMVTTPIAANATEVFRWGANLAGEIMDTEPSYVTEDSSLAEAAKIFLRDKINELPVVDSEMHLVGQISFYEIIMEYQEAQNKEV